MIDEPLQQDDDEDGLDEPTPVQPGDLSAPLPDNKGKGVRGG